MDAEGRAIVFGLVRLALWVRWWPASAMGWLGLVICRLLGAVGLYAGAPVLLNWLGRFTGFLRLGQLLFSQSSFLGRAGHARQMGVLEAATDP